MSYSFNKSTFSLIGRKLHEHSLWIPRAISSSVESPYKARLNFAYAHVYFIIT